MKVGVNRELCRGHAMCMSFAPDVFEVDEAGFVVAPASGQLDVGEDADLESVKMAIEGCPEGALSLED